MDEAGATLFLCLLKAFTLVHEWEEGGRGKSTREVESVSFFVSSGTGTGAAQRAKDK
jgi:hypothetical protein